MTPDRHPPEKAERSEFLTSLRNGAILGVLILAVAIPWMRMNQKEQAPPARPVAQVPAQAPAMPERLADFGEEPASEAVRHVAHWAFFTGDNQGKAVFMLDKKAAKVYAFDPSGKLVSATPALLGEAIGDHTVPGIGDKPLAEIRPHEKTTHAGRFVARPGMNADGEDVVWVDYQAAISMHRVRATNPAERRLQRLASETAADNRISYGCVNLPVAFYEQVLSPTVKRVGAIVYVLPETRSPQEVFGSFDVTDPAQVALARAMPRVLAAAQAPATQVQARQQRDI